MRVLVAADGESSLSRDDFLARIGIPDKVVVADGALRHIARLGLTPDFIVGDLDSVTPELLNFYKDIQVERYPRDKDKTDLEIAVERALSLKPTEIVFIGMFGGRVDHQFGNILLLTTITGVKLRIEDSCIKGFVLNGEGAITLQKSKGFSLIPLTREVHGVTISGAKWDLDNHMLTLGSPTALCNEFVDSKAKISTSSGSLLILQQL